MSTVGGSYSWNAICDVCGFQYKANQLRKRWDGLIVCADDWEMRHPLDFYKTRDDTHKLPFIRKEPTSSESAHGFFSVAYPTDDTTNTVLGANSYGNRFTALTSGYFDAARVYLPNITQTQQMWLVLLNVTTSTILWTKLVTDIPTGLGWHTWAITPNVACEYGTEYMIFISTEANFQIEVEDTLIELAAQDYLHFTTSMLSSGSGFDTNNIPDTVGSVLYLIDISVIPDGIALADRDSTGFLEMDIQSQYTNTQVTLARNHGNKFTVTSAKTLTGIRYYYNASAAEEVKFAIWQHDEGNEANSVVLATETVTIYPDRWVEVVFNPTVALSPATVYSVVAFPTDTSMTVTGYDQNTVPATPADTGSGVEWDSSVVAIPGGLDTVAYVDSGVFYFLDVITE